MSFLLVCTQSFTGRQFDREALATLGLPISSERRLFLGERFGQSEIHCGYWWSIGLLLTVGLSLGVLLTLFNRHTHRFAHYLYRCSGVNEGPRPLVCTFELFVALPYLLLR